MSPNSRPVRVLRTCVVLHLNWMSHGSSGLAVKHAQRSAQRRRQRKVRRLLNLMRQATRLNLEDPFRKGVLIEFP